MRFEKFKATNIASLPGSLSHTFRSRYTPNAAKEKVKDNRVLLGPTDHREVAEAVRARWPERFRKDAIGFIELFIGASPEFFEKHGGSGDEEQYFRRAIQWLKDYYGAENVISVVQHNDETTPHLAAYVVPIRPDTGALSAKFFADGRRGCSELQTAFHKAAGEAVGLERGVRGSNAEHTSIRRWYAESATLEEQRREVKYGTFDIEARETEIEESLQSNAARERWLNRAEMDQQRREYELVYQEEELSQRASTLAAERLSLDAGTEALAERERNAQTRSARLDSREKAVEKRLAKAEEKEEELSQRASTLAAERLSLDAGTEALAERERNAQTRSARLDSREKALREWEQKREAWLAENRPPEVPDLVRRLRKVAAMGRREAVEWMSREENDDLMDWYNPVDDSYTPQAQALLDQYSGAIEELERWQRTVEPQRRGPKGPGH